MARFNPFSCGSGASTGGAYYNYANMAFACWGDSLTANGTGYADTLATSYTPTRKLYNGGVGGYTIAQAFSAQTAAPLYRDRILIIHDKMNSGETVDAYVATVQAMIAYQPRMFLIVSGIFSTDGSQDPGSAYYIRQSSVNTQLAALYPANFLDVSVLLADDTTRSDGVHLTTTARDTILIPAIAQKLVDLGYMNVTS